MSEGQPVDGDESSVHAGLPQDLNGTPLPGAREFILAVLVLSNGVRPVSDLDQRELADAVNTSPQDVRNAFKDLRDEGVISVSEDDWATLHLGADAWRRLAVAFA
ncbi:MAG: helix-turn-helix domain-containing protein, partial [Actinomycetota bacterium]